MLYSDEEEENTWTLPEDCEILHVIVMGQPSDLFLSFYIVSPELHTKFEWKLFEGIQSLCTLGKPFRIFMDCWCNGLHPLNKYELTLDHSFPIKYIYKEIPFQELNSAELINKQNELRHAQNLINGPSEAHNFNKNDEINSDGEIFLINETLRKPLMHIANKRERLAGLETSVSNSWNRPDPGQPSSSFSHGREGMASRCF